jgi:hypothetical protein
MSLVGMLFALLTAQVPAASEPRWEVETVWFGLALDVQARTRTPLSFGLHVADLGVTSPTGRFSLEVPCLTVGWDYFRPSRRGGSVSLSFVQAPVLLALANLVTSRRPTRPWEALMGSLLWLSGGTFGWTPGGRGNVHRSPRRMISVSAILANQVDLHVLVRPAYVRETPAIGLGVRGDSPHWLTGHVVPDYACTVALFASVAQELAGQRSLDRGLWVKCAVGYIPVY